MKRLLAALVFFVIPALHAQDTVISRLVQHWQTSKAYTLAIAEQMPADSYGFKPNPAEMTFGEQLVHIAQVNGFFISKVAGTPSPVGKPETMDKATIVKFVGDSYDYAIKSIGSLTPEQLHAEVELEGQKMQGFEGLLLAADHTTHHRAQCIVYLRVKGIKPADYRF
jgi:uncharacterized damage-inducible protein DinB